MVDRQRHLARAASHRNDRSRTDNPEAVVVADNPNCNNRNPAAVVAVPNKDKADTRTPDNRTAQVVRAHGRAACQVAAVERQR